MKIETLKVITDDRGSLSVMEPLPFDPKRIFYVTDVPQGTKRGNHAHLLQSQILICIKGRIIVHLYNGIGDFYYGLTPGESILIPPMNWGIQEFITSNSVMLVLCSGQYDKEEYITDINKFKELCSKLPTALSSSTETSFFVRCWNLFIRLLTRSASRKGR